MFWNCPKCRHKVDFIDQMGYVSEEDGEASFDPKRGLMFHTIECGNDACGAHWIVSISEMYEER